MLSVILTCYNEGGQILDAINSLQNQTFLNFETIIVKDFSTDLASIEICKSLEELGYKVLWLEKNSGVSVARNLGISHSSGDIVYTFDADDELPEKAIETVLEAFDRHSDADVVYGNYQLIDWESASSAVVDCSVFNLSDNSFDVKKYISNPLVYGNSPMKKSAWKKVNGYSEEFTYTCQDLDLHLRLLAIGAKFIYTPQTIYIWKRNATGINSSLANKIAYDKCMFNNIDLLIKYSDNHKYILHLLRQFGQPDQYRTYCIRKATEKNRSYLAVVCSIIPIRLLPYVTRFI